MAFFKLLLSLSSERRFCLLPVSRGAFSAIHIVTKSDAQPYGDAEFAFAGAKNHLRWWFRKPAFESGAVVFDQLSSVLSPLSKKDNGEVTFDIGTVEDAERVLNCIL